MVGANQLRSRRTKMERLVGKKVLAKFVFSTGEEIPLKDEIQKNEEQSKQGYFLKKYGIQLPLKYTRFNGYEASLRVNVPEGSSIEQQLKDSGVLK